MALTFRRIHEPTLLILFASFWPQSDSAVPEAQEAVAGPPVPGLYVAQQCKAAPFPVQLPPIDSVVDTAALTPILKSAGVNKRIVFALRLGALETTPRVRVIEKKVSDEVGELATSAVEHAFRPAPSEGDWGFRLRVEIDADLTLSLERSRICAGAPGPSEMRREVAVVRADEAQRMIREAELTASRLRSMRHRVLVDSTGRVLTVELVTSSGDVTMDVNYAEGLRRRRFTPTLLDGVPVTAWVEVRGDHGLGRR